MTREEFELFLADRWIERLYRICRTVSNPHGNLKDRRLRPVLDFEAAFAARNVDLFVLSGVISAVRSLREWPDDDEAFERARTALQAIPTSAAGWINEIVRDVCLDCLPALKLRGLP